MTQIFNERVIAALPVPAKGAERYTFSGALVQDGEVPPGFSVKVFATGLRTYVLRYLIDGAERLYTIGWVGDLPPLAAVKEARALRQMIDRGEDPLVMRSKAHAKAAGADLVESIFEKWLVHEAGMKRSANGTPTFSGKLRSAEDRMRIFERLVYPEVEKGAKGITLRGMAFEEVTRTDIARLLDRIAEENGERTADLTLAYMSVVFRWNESRSDSFRSPIVKGMKRQKPKEHARACILSDAELHAVWKATENGETSHRFMRFVLLTAARRSEAAEMPWDEIRVVPTPPMAEQWAAHWTLPETRNKTKEELIRPLSKLALATLPEPKGRFVFSTDGGATFISDFSTMRAALSKASETSGWTFHDLRRTSRTLMSRAGVPSDIAERCLGHVIGGVRGAYDRYRYFNEMLDAYEKLAALIERIVDAKESVTPMSDAGDRTHSMSDAADPRGADIVGGARRGANCDGESLP